MKLAEYQDLYYVKKVDFGVYLAEDMGEMCIRDRSVPRILLHRQISY